MIKSGVIKDIEIAVKVIDAFLKKDKSIISVVFYGTSRYDIHHRDFPWWLVEFPERCKVIVDDGSVFVQEVV